MIYVGTFCYNKDAICGKFQQALMLLSNMLVLLVFIATSVLGCGESCVLLMVDGIFREKIDLSVR